MMTMTVISLDHLNDFGVLVSLELRVYNRRNVTGVYHFPSKT